ncbi:hypothetical protein EZ449_05645 [Pedobacter frigidisoli]|uniref:Uncharacterized protein n=1 Tax=Pedobacter frigidisoli TaxID=2530455 RepID=A0A4V2MN85_9SPHI|nr:hypothetical protein [Pedobacter frigidisoli]TCD11740.1 hypothetical protein EZ449_05645 [Pedobacter frigidisoli]
MLRHEASATDETDASCLSMTASLKKIGTDSGAAVPEELAALIFKGMLFNVLFRVNLCFRGK